MPFCEECGNEITESAKFCPNCGTKTKGETVVTKTIKKKIKKKPEQVVQTSSPKEEQATNDIDEKDTEYLKEFFTLPIIQEDNDNEASPMAFIGLGLFFLIASFLFDPESEFLWWVLELGLGLLLILMGLNEMTKDKKDNIGKDRKKLTKDEKLKEWREMSPEPLFRRLDQAQKIVADSSFDGLGINKSAKPSEGGVIRTPAYSYGPHLDFTDFIFGKVDKDGIGKGAGYYKICEDSVDGGLYTREYDMMVIQFTQNQILVYKCIFDILEMTKRLEESYEWNYKHVVGINISGDDKEKNLGASISVTGTKYMVISAASGDKIEIILGAETNELVNGKKKKSHLGGEDKIFEIANAAVKNVREAIREKAG